MKRPNRPYVCVIGAAHADGVKPGISTAALLAMKENIQRA